MKRLLLVVVTLILVSNEPASAQAVARADPQDTKGKLDVTRISYTQDEGGPTFRLLVRTDRAWRCRYLRPANHTRLRWKIDDAKSNAADYVGKFVCRQGKLAFEISSKDGAENFEPLPTKRPSRRSVVVNVPNDIFDGVDDVWVTSLDKEATACDTACRDRAPDNGGLLD